ncbi:MAG: MSMEG_0570 family nitrogen starvation response protein [Cyanobacteria bacterium P01_G01_bin.54]
MPEIRFQIEWPDATQDTCYSPSLVVKQYFEAQTEYPLTDFVARSRAALQEGSDRVKAKFGRPCGLALGQLQHIEEKSVQYTNEPDARVKVVGFLE